jgi:hypothetical protein
MAVLKIKIEKGTVWSDKDNVSQTKFFVKVYDWDGFLWFKSWYTKNTFNSQEEAERYADFLLVQHRLETVKEFTT